MAHAVVVSEITSKDDFNAFKQDGIQKVDFLLVDLDSIVDQPALINRILEDDAILEPAKLLLVGSTRDPSIQEHPPKIFLVGYLLKDEISSSLRLAITFAAEGERIHLFHT
ncbi:MAG: hypothetical protein MZV64_16540 [Ignavibacteriales bacterium]|nr:hypothetical protein [Ignavibacteriales bacterium]